jgi:hypothetical protein
MTQESTVVLVTMRHIRIAQMCSEGTRSFFKRHNLDWAQFLRIGLPAEQFEATGDAMAIKVAEIARGT